MIKAITLIVVLSVAAYALGATVPAQKQGDLETAQSIGFGYGGLGYGGLGYGGLGYGGLGYGGFGGLGGLGGGLGLGLGLYGR